MIVLIAGFFTRQNRAGPETVGTGIPDASGHGSGKLIDPVYDLGIRDFCPAGIEKAFRRKSELMDGGKRKHNFWGIKFGVLILFILLSMIGCSNKSGKSASGSTDKNQESTEPETQSDKKVQWEITYQSCVLKEILKDIPTMYAIVEVENTGTSDLYLKDAAFDLEDDNGTLMATYSTGISCDPDIIAPGEKGYFYCTQAIPDGDIDVDLDYHFVPHLKLEKSRNKIIRYEISETQISEGVPATPVTVIGRIKNNTEDDAPLIWVAVVLFREDDTPISAFGTTVYELAAGEQTSFSTDGLRLAGLDFSYSEIARYEIYASKTQYQF